MGTREMTIQRPYEHRHLPHLPSCLLALLQMRTRSATLLLAGMP